MTTTHPAGRPLLPVTPLPDLPFAQGDTVWDEMVTGDGRVRPAWEGLFGTIAAVPEGGMAERAARARQVMADDGVTYNVAGDPRARERPWTLDLIPFPIGAEEWAQLEAGLLQRTAVLEAVLADLYGPQRLLRERVVPAAVLDSHPAFLRALVRHEPWPHERLRPAGVAAPPKLLLYAVDLVRAADGRWTVLADHTDLGAGAGYALRNRRTLARTMPEFFRAPHARRLRGFFERLGQGLQAFAPGAAGAAGRSVLLSPGIAAETYYGQVYLARELQIPLVEAGDLTVRDGRLLLKTLGGLQPVQGVLRRLPAQGCDPLEFDAGDSAGVAGLTEAIRLGTVFCGNGLEAGLLENPALFAFLPAAARHLTGTELRLPQMETLWAGDPAVAARLAAEPQGWVLADAQAQPVRRLAPPQALAFDAASLPPGRLVARRRLTASVAPTVPVLSPGGSSPGESSPALAGGDGALVPQPIILRLFIGHDGQGPMVMPGGIARVLVEADPFAAALPVGMSNDADISKDVWVLAPAPQETGRVFAPSVGLKPRRSSGEVSSRAADNLYWIGRAAERIDGAARLLRAILWRVAQGSLGGRDTVEGQALLGMAGALGWLEAELAQSPIDGRPTAAALTDLGRADRTLALALAGLRQQAIPIRERFSTDLWLTLNAGVQEARDGLAAATGSVDRTIAALDRVIRLGAAVAGMTLENMTRGSGWRFLDAGRRLERAAIQAALFHGLLTRPGLPRDGALRLVLELADSAITYRTRYLAAVEPLPVLDLVLTDETNPRALAFQLRHLVQHLDALPTPAPAPEAGRAPAAPLSVEPLRLIRALTQALDPMGGDPAAEVAPVLETMGGRLFALSDRITRAYFSLVRSDALLGVATWRPPAAAAQAGAVPTRGNG